MDEKTESLVKSKPEIDANLRSDLDDSRDIKSVGLKNKTTMFNFKKMVILISFIVAIGISFYCLLLSHNAIQAFIPYDEDKVLLEPSNYPHARLSESGHINFQGHAHVQSAELSQRMASIEQKLQQVTAQQQNANRLLDREPVNLDPVKDQMAIIIQKVAVLEQQLNQMVAEQKKVMIIYATFEQLKEAVNQGNVFESILNHLYDLLPATGDVRNQLQLLVEYSSVGAASYQQLYEELAVISSKRKKDVAPLNRSNDDWWMRIVALMKSFIKVHKVGDSTFHQTINLDEAFEKVATLLLSKSDVKSLIDILAPFEKNLSTIELNFYNQLMARMTVEDCLNRMDQILLSARFLQTLNPSQ